MRPERVMLLIAACCCLVAAVYSIVGQKKKTGKTGYLLWSFASGMVLIDTALLIYYQLSGQFQFIYVSAHTSTDLAAVYKVSALWSGQEGSFLLWSAILCIIGYGVLNLNRNNFRTAFSAYALISCAVIIMTFLSDPFQIAEIPPADGAGLNEALKNPWMVVHPPLVFIAYSAMAVLFSLGIGLRRDPFNTVENNSVIRKWMRLSWAFLGIGIFTGSVWAYQALGWGGYWSWDPIENAALVPWLVLCAFLHSRGRLGRFQCIIPFVLAVFGTFLTRSGALEGKSLHAYTGGNNLAPYLLLSAFLIVILLLALLEIREDNGSESIRDGKKQLTLFKNITCFYAYLILLGTVAPFFININVSTDYYNMISAGYAVFCVLMLMTRDGAVLASNYIQMLLLNTAVVFACILFIFDSLDFLWVGIFWLCLLPASLWAVSLFHKKRLRVGMVHLGVVLLITGTIASSALGSHGLGVGQESGNIDIRSHEITAADLAEKDMMIISSITEDIVVMNSEAALLGSDPVLVPYNTKPLILMFWIGGAFITFGALLQFLVRKREY